ncbi:hypothetical protein [Jeotgalibacillus marinus]|uniref:Uncharacterized protein n=1 Tax=Jeotgalibacillus marinus TaxID=86667 RepID=A0ABV3Q6B2_9BACL
MKIFSLFTKLFLAILLFVSMLVPHEVSASEEKSAFKLGKEFGLEILSDVLVNPDPEYSRGNSPAITVLDNGLVVAIKEYDLKLYYQFGEYNDGKMYWSYPKEYDTGFSPTASTLPNGHIIDIHLGHYWKQKLFYNLGRYDEKTGEIDWYSVGNFYNEHAKDPSMTVLANGDVLEVHENGSDMSNNLYYNLGRYKDGKIEWNSLGNKYDAGRTPSITALDNGSVLEVHKSQWNNGLWYSTGTQNGNSFDFTDSSNYEDHGRDPVSLQLDNGLILTMFEGTRGHHPTWNRMGQVNGDKIEWTTNTFTEFNGRDNDVVQLQNGLMLNVHQSPDDDTLWYVLGRWKPESNRVVWWPENLGHN